MGAYQLIKTMKEKALFVALDDPSKSGESTEENYNKTYRLRCHCHELTDFGFVLDAYNNGRWSSLLSLTEHEAVVFLYGTGHSR